MAGDDHSAMAHIPFVKMEGCGNDYVFIDAGLTPQGVDPSRLADLPRAVPAISDRHRGVGGDGVIALFAADRGAVRMRMWNADGSEGLLCLNGLRCAAKFTAERTDAGDAFVVETAAGDRRVHVHRDGEGRVETVEVEAGVPDFRRSAIPAPGDGEELWGERFYLGGIDLPGYGVSVGNPHLVLWMEEETAVRRADLPAIGTPFQRDPRFPEGVNVHLVSRGNAPGLVMRSWERGSGATLACGSGAVAAFAVARRLGAADAESAVAMPGGAVTMIERQGGDLVMHGPAREVFRGIWDPGGGR